MITAVIAFGLDPDAAAIFMLVYVLFVELSVVCYVFFCLKTLSFSGCAHSLSLLSFCIKH